jgi:hypothetical protein
VYKATNIHWGKVTHLRKQGIDKAKQGGASREDITQQTNHGNESIDVSYLPELPPDVMHIAAGLSLRHGETMYFVGRVFIRFDDPDLPLVPDNPNISDTELAGMLFVHYHRWVREHESGLEWPCGTNFLKKLLPFLARVLVQDGVFWVEMDPQHEVSRLLISVFGERYIEWADKQRKAVREIEKNTTNKQIQALDAGAQAALSSVNSNVIPIKHVLETLVEEIKNLRKTVEISQQRMEQQHTLGTSPSIGLRQNPPTTGATRERMVALCPPAPLAPYFPIELPSCMQNLLEEHLRYKLEDFKGVSKKCWTKGLAMALSRRSYLFRLIVEKAVMLRSGNDMAFKQQEAARQLDEERGTMSLSKFYDKKTPHDSSRQKRKGNPVQGGRKRTRRVNT